MQNAFGTLFVYKIKGMVNDLAHSLQYVNPS
jgi:hypothetical protein